MQTARVTTAIALIVATLSVSTAQAIPRNWNVGSGNWNTPTNWLPNGVPQTDDVVSIGFADNTARTITYDYPGPPITLQSLGIDLQSTNASTITFNQAANTLIANYEYVGYFGKGTFNQSGGQNTAAVELHLGETAGSTGIYNISNSALLSATNALVGVGGTGTLNIQGATPLSATPLVSITNQLSINTTSNVNLNGGTLRFNTVSGLNRLIYNAGTIQLAGSRALGFDVDIPVLFPGHTIPAGKALIVEGGADIRTIVAVTGGSLDVLSPFFRVGFGDPGVLNISNLGFVTANSDVTVGGTITNTSGAISVIGSGSTFSGTGNFALGNVGPGMLEITSGGSTITSGNATIGSAGINGTGTATVNGPDSTWNIAGNLDLTGAASGRGTLNIQNQGTVVVGGALTITGSNVVNLNGGTLQLNTVTGASLNLLNFTAGTIQLAGNRTIGSDAIVQSIFGINTTVITGKALNILGTATISSSLTLIGGTLKTNGLVVNGAFQFNSGVLELTGGTITGLAQLTVPSSGEFRAAGVHSLRVTGAAGSTITATGNLTLGNATAVNGFGTQGTFAVGANTVTLLDANDVVFDSLSLATLGSGASAGTLNAANGLTLDFGGNITGFGTVSTPNDIARPLINNGHITGNSPAQRITLPGYVKGVGTFDNVNFTGTFSPGLSPTILTVGNVALTATSTLIMELGGTAAGSGYDQLQSAGTLTFDGTLQIALINNFTPTAGQSFNLFDFTTATGTFATLQLPTLAGLAWNTSQLYTSGIISLAAAGLPGDYNQDGIVDAADYTVWRNHLASGQPLPNDDSPGVGQDDYTRWKQNFGTGSGSGQLATVPEPSCLLLLVAATSIIAANKGSRCSPRRRRTSPSSTDYGIAG